MPYGFIQHHPKTIIRAKALVSYGPGSHKTTSTSGSVATVLGTRFLHYQTRNYDSFERKISNAARWLRENSQL